MAARLTVTVTFLVACRPAVEVLVRGRKPRSTASHRLRGTFDRSRHAPSAVVVLAPLDLSAPPPWLTGERELAIWHRDGAELVALGILKSIDQWVFGIYCGVAARYEAMREEGEPFPGILETTREVMLEYAEDIGLTPASRARLTLQ